MLKKYLAGIFVIALLISAGILLAGKPARTANPKAAPACCKTEKTCKPAVKPSAPASTLEQLSSQFISIPLFNH